MTAATVPVGAADTSQGTASTRFRTDIQGLRAIAVVLVLLYHAGLPWVPGGYVGVDVFFVISGFLITGLIVREIRTTGRLSLRTFYARRARRLLPATAVTFAGVALLTVVALPVTRWTTIAGDMVASTLYVVNWRLAERSVDYLAEGTAASPLQHFWSLAVEEQFYVLWPLLIVALVWWAGRGVSTRRLMLGLLVIAVPSLVWSVVMTASDPAAAYFVTTTRLWQLAVGALLAVGVQSVGTLPRWLRAGLGWTGLVAILIAATTFTAETPFPGTAALLPTLGAVAVLVAGSGDGSGRLRPLDLPVMQDVGALSYSLYLWHWPLLVVAAAVWGGAEGELWLPTALMVVGFSAVPAWFTYRLVEKPIHQMAFFAVPWRAALLALACIGIGLGSAAAIQAAVPSTSAAADPGEGEGLAAGEALGALALGADPRTSSAALPTDRVPSITPDPLVAADDNAGGYADGCHQDQQGAEVLRCVYGDTESGVRVLLVGDSHAAHWQPALREAAEASNWRLEVSTKSACFFGDVEVWNANQARGYESCTEWNEALLADIESDPPAIVVTSMSGGHAIAVEGERLGRPAADAVLAGGLSRSLDAVGATGAAIVVILDTPAPGINVPECVAENRNKLTACSVPRSEAMERSAAEIQVQALNGKDWVEALDVTDYVCPGELCAPVIGGVLVYRDAHHLTRTYASSLGREFGLSIESVLSSRSPHKGN